MLKTKKQHSKYASPWSLAIRLKGALWRVIWRCLGSWTPKPFNIIRIYILKIFGANIKGAPFVSGSAKIRMPWNLVLEDHACIGENVIIYNLDKIILLEGCTISQEAYLCGGTHDFFTPECPLQVGAIVIGMHAFVGARAFILPGCTIGDFAVIGATSTISKSVPAGEIWAGNPAKQIGVRVMEIA